MIVGLSGYAQSGKDTVAGILVDHHDYRRVAFADKLRDVALTVDPFVHLHHNPGQPSYPVRLSELVGHIGWDRAKVDYPEVRRTLQALGCSVRDHVDPWAWVKAALAGVDVDEDIVISDVRFRNEAEAITARGGLMVRVHRPGVDAINGHVSEHDLDDWPFDYDIANDGTLDELAGVVDRLLKVRA